VQASPDSADGHYILAAAIGRASLTKSKKERVRRAAEIRTEALRAIELNPQQDRAYHVLGRWNAEVMRLSGLQRFLAKSFMGGAVFSQASWNHAIEYLAKAVELVPASIYHRLDLAEVYVDRDRYREARELLSAIGDLSVYDAMDPTYQEQAAALLKKIQGKQDKS
jgi:tetratricopeptide (TPR) repeat protein